MKKTLLSLLIGLLLAVGVTGCHSLEKGPGAINRAFNPGASK